MNIIGIICEYNPFHNGHLYHIKKIKELYPNSLIIVVMSSNVTERGDLSLINKWDKTEIALNYGIDLVVELPFTHSSQSADTFCFGSIKLLNYLKVDTIVFGSESNDIKTLTDLAQLQLDSQEYNLLIQKYLKEGFNYPTSLAKALNNLTNKNINQPNDILGIGYIREILKNNYPITPVCIKRTNEYNSKNLNGTISSATSIREAIKKKKNINKYVPFNPCQYLNKPTWIEDYYPYLKYKIISEIDTLNKYQTVDEQLLPRIKKNIYTSNTLDELILKIKSKNYTYNKLKRMFIHILMSFTKEEALKYKDITYIRVLGFNKKGQKYLNDIKKQINIPILTNYNDQFLNIEYRVNSIIGLNKDITFTTDEYKHKPIIKDKN